MRFESTISDRAASIAAPLSKSREGFRDDGRRDQFVLPSISSAANEALGNLDTIVNTIPVMLDLADADIQRSALQRPQIRARQLKEACRNSPKNSDEQSRFLHDVVDRSQTEMSELAGGAFGEHADRETRVQDQFDRALSRVFTGIAIVTLVSLAVIGFFGTLRTIDQRALTGNHAVDEGDRAGRLDLRVVGTQARDEIGEMARAVEVFRENAISNCAPNPICSPPSVAPRSPTRNCAPRKNSLIEAEKFAALGAVAGVAHEVNNWSGSASQSLEPCPPLRKFRRGDQARRTQTVPVDGIRRRQSRGGQHAACEPSSGG